MGIKDDFTHDFDSYITHGMVHRQLVCPSTTRENQLDRLFFLEINLHIDIKYSQNDRSPRRHNYEKLCEGFSREIIERENHHEYW